jgi:hypothetical protein
MSCPSLSKSHSPNDPISQAMTLTYLDAQIVLETGEIGRQASGAVMATEGETVGAPG